jgi:precorrin-6B methylase 2
MDNEIYSITTEAEREALRSLASQVEEGGTIVEVGCLYGGVTAVLAKASPSSTVITIDDFSWHPEGMPVTSKELVEKSMLDLNIKNVRIKEGDSRRIGKSWKKPIDLLWIDGGHSYQFVYSDLINFGQHAWVIALHDYDNPIWPTVRQAVETYIKKDNIFYVDKVVDTLCVLRRQ